MKSKQPTPGQPASSARLDELIEATKQLVAIPSTGTNPVALREAFDFMVKRLDECKKDITIEQFESNGKPSFIAYRGPKRPDNFRIILNGHLDVVPGSLDQYKAFVKDGKLYGRGVFDMKAACIVLMDAFCKFVDKAPYPLGLQIVTDEESAGKDGTLFQIQHGVRGDFVICGECGRQSDVHEIANEAKGIVCMDIKIKGTSHHGAYPWRGRSAALRAMDFVGKVHERFPVPSKPTSGTTMTVTAIDAQSGAHTRTPDTAMVRLDARYAASDPNFRSRQHVAALIEEIDPNAEIIEFFDFSSPLYTDPKNPLLLSLKASAEKVEGAPFTLATRNATSDGRYYGDVGDQACEFGIAGEDQHGDDEHITLKAFENYYKTIDDFLAKTITSERGHAHTQAFEA